MCCAWMLQGKGGYGDVFEGSWRGQPVAVKKLPLLNDYADGLSLATQHEALIAEIKLHSRFECNRLVRVHTVRFILYDSYVLLA